MKLPQWDIQRALPVNREKRATMVSQTKSLLWGHNIELSRPAESTPRRRFFRTQAPLHTPNLRGRLQRFVTCIPIEFFIVRLSIRFLNPTAFSIILRTRPSVRNRHSVEAFLRHSQHSSWTAFPNSRGPFSNQRQQPYSAYSATETRPAPKLLMVERPGRSLWPYFYPQMRHKIVSPLSVRFFDGPVLKPRRLLPP